MILYRIVCRLVRRHRPRLRHHVGHTVTRHARRSALVWTCRVTASIAILAPAPALSPPPAPAFRPQGGAVYLPQSLPFRPQGGALLPPEAEFIPALNYLPGGLSAAPEGPASAPEPSALILLTTALFALWRIRQKTIRRTVG